MINRIVRMSFVPGKVDEFLGIFNESKMKIAAFDGCKELKLLRDAKASNIFFTFSIWEDETKLDAYRFSELFKRTWSRTKILFNEKPQAWSTLIEDDVK
ncbi:MAG: putative quinol monooxygenase [Bacteroidia bacterium]